MEFRVPELGEGVYEAELVEWLVRAGQGVSRGDALAEVMTDKATLELPAPFDGVIESLSAQAGQRIEIGQVLLHYAANGSGAAVSDAMDGEISKGEVGQREMDGQAVDQSDGEVSAGVGRAVRGTPSRPASDGQGHGEETRHAAVVATPAVRKMAQAMRVNLGEVRGSGPDGRVLIEDLGKFVRTQRSAVKRLSRRPVEREFVKPGQRLPLQGLRRSIAEHMVTAKRTIPHYSYIDECDVSRMIALRNALKRPLYATGIKLTNLPFYVKAVVGALQQVPLVNSSIDEKAGEIILHDRYDIGIATATSRGLMVPVIRAVDQKDLAEIARDIESLIRAAQAGTIARSDLHDGTFTISSVGNFGGLVSTPIVHHPQVGIVAIGKIFKRPTYNDDGDIVPAQIAYLSFSFDHRVVDGSVGAQFGNAMIQQLQDPQTLADGVDLS